MPPKFFPFRKLYKMNTYLVETAQLDRRLSDNLLMLKH